jgi:hypothetical protein
MGEVHGSTKKRISIWWAISSALYLVIDEQSEFTVKKIAFATVVPLVLATEQGCRRLLSL